MINHKIKRKNVEGVEIVIVDTDAAVDLQVSVVYELPLTLDSKYAGVPHMFEHLVFTDILDGIRSSTEIMSLASKHNITISASTSKQLIRFDLTMQSFILSKDDPGYRSLKRFDISESAYPLFIKLISGIVKQHAFTNEDLFNERGIVLSELASCEGTDEDVYNRLVTVMSGSSILGTEREIGNMSTKLINDFASRLPLPRIAIKTDSRREYFCEIEDDIEDIIVLNRRNIPDSADLKNVVMPNLKSVSTRIYDGITDIREISRDLNALAVVLPVTLSVTPRDTELEVLKMTAVSMILDPFVEGSLGNLLREKLNVIYGFSGAGPLRGKFNANISAWYTPVEKSIDFKDAKSLQNILTTLDQCLCNMECPSETEYASALSNNVIPVFRSYNLHGVSINYAIKLLFVHVSRQVTDRTLEMPFDFSYEQFVEVFDEVKNSISLAIL